MRDTRLDTKICPMILSADRNTAVAAVTRALGFSPAIIVGGEAHRFMIADQLAAVGATLLEPAGRNTAAAIVLAAH